MPGMDGFETAQRIKKMFPEREIPIVFISAVYTDDPYILKGYRVGGVDYIPKPFEPDVLKAKVRLYTEAYKKSRLLQVVEKQLGEIASRYKSLLDHIPDPLFSVSPEGNLTYLNKALEALAGVKSGEQLGKPLGSLFNPADVPEVTGAFEKMRKDRQKRSVRARLLTAPARDLPVETRMSLIVQDSILEGAVFVLHDLSQKNPLRPASRQKVLVD
jgi:PAS domain S-box-containing protein